MQTARNIRLKLKKYLLRKDDPDYWWALRQKALHSPGRLTRLWYTYCHQKLLIQHNAFIPLTAQFASEPTLPHGLNGILVSSSAVIGRNCTLFHQVTVGSNTLSDSKNPGAPILGDDVYVGAGAKIIGSVHIGSHVRVGANCVITVDIPDNATAVLPRPVIIPHKEPRENTFTSIHDYENPD